MVIDKKHVAQLLEIFHPREKISFEDIFGPDDLPGCSD
jgi:hypothetical protein